jgi:hypothetical protein
MATRTRAWSGELGDGEWEVYALRRKRTASRMTLSPSPLYSSRTSNAWRRRNPRCLSQDAYSPWTTSDAEGRAHRAHSVHASSRRDSRLRCVAAALQSFRRSGLLRLVQVWMNWPIWRRTKTGTPNQYVASIRVCKAGPRSRDLGRSVLQGYGRGWKGKAQRPGVAHVQLQLVYVTSPRW